MKKILVLSFAMLLCVMCVFVGCSSNEGDNDTTTDEVTTNANTTDEDTTVEDTTAEDTTEANTSDEANDSEEGGASENSALAAYAQGQEAFYEAVNNELLSVHCLARGNSLVYTYNISTVTDAAGAEEYLSYSLESTYSAMLSVVRLEVPDCESIIVEILDQSGNVLASKSYT